MLVIDTISKTVIEDVNFRDWVPGIPRRFSIFKFVPIGNIGIRVLIKDNGGFSFNWRSIGK